MLAPAVELAFPPLAGLGGFHVQPYFFKTIFCALGKQKI